MKKLYTFIITIILGVLVTSTLPMATFAADSSVENKPDENYTLLEAIPCIQGNDVNKKFVGPLNEGQARYSQECNKDGLIEVVKIDEYLRYLFRILIALAVFAAVFQITFAGFKYMFSEVITDKGAAKKTIRDSVFGLLGVLASYLILYTINPDLVRFSGKIESLELSINYKLNSLVATSRAELERNANEFYANKIALKEAKKTLAGMREQLTKLELELTYDGREAGIPPLSEDERAEKQAAYDSLSATTKKLAGEIILKGSEDAVLTKANEALRNLNDTDASVFFNDREKILNTIASQITSVEKRFNTDIAALQAIGANEKAKILEQEKIYYIETLKQEVKVVSATKSYEGAKRSFYAKYIVGGEVEETRNIGVNTTKLLETRIQDPNFAQIGLTDPTLRARLLEETRGRIDRVKAAIPLPKK